MTNRSGVGEADALRSSSRRHNRRFVLKAMAGLPLAAPALSIAPAASTVLLGTEWARAQTAEELIQPGEIRSDNGVLKATLTATADRVKLGDFAFPGFVYNRAYLPPLLRVRVGDTMAITFRNGLPDDPSNLHYHGMAVSPLGNSDNVFILVHPGQEFDYKIHIPVRDRQGPGLFWYHPHAHGFVAKQILGGMSGGIVVEGSEQLFPILGGLAERFFFFKHVELGEESEIISVNGQLNPHVRIQPGELQFWRIANIGATLFIKFHIEGMPLYVLATDGHPLSRPRKLTEFFLGPGERIDVIAIGPQSGEYAMTTIPFQNSAGRKPSPPQRIAGVISAGAPTATADIEAAVLRHDVQGRRWFDEVRSTPVARSRTLVYSRTPDRQHFMINGRMMDENRVDQTVKLGDTEEWTIINNDQQYHSFHIHQTAFMVTELNGIPQNEDSLRDTFSVPPATHAGPGMLKVVIPFTDPVIVGRFVYHCHAVDHEDKGMMGIIEVVA
ncbi:multicopper oxidase family protein [Mesorhizobium sp. Cs1299R1N1]|uniref:multicopper oxidase family protein n=1 Tax=Mesorhizobium sp. Cs1299R1N1 TaxID=3015172 RepID=UPI00301DC47C